MTPAEILFLVFHAHQIQKLGRNAEAEGQVFYPVTYHRPLACGLQAVARIQPIEGATYFVLILKGPDTPEAAELSRKAAKDFFFKGKYSEAPAVVQEANGVLRAFYSRLIITTKEAADFVQAGHGAHSPGSTGDLAERTATHVVGDIKERDKPK